MNKHDFPNDHLLHGTRGMKKKTKKKGDEVQRVRKAFKEFQARHGNSVSRLTWDDDGVYGG